MTSNSSVHHGNGHLEANKARTDGRAEEGEAMSQSKVDSPAALARSPQSSVEGPSWLLFPTHERILASGDLVVLQRLESTYRRVGAVSKSGTASERKRASVVLTAFERTRNLLGTVLEARKKLIR
jgi:hypothetical protein